MLSLCRLSKLNIVNELDMSLCAAQFLCTTSAFLCISTVLSISKVCVIMLIMLSSLDNSEIYLEANLDKVIFYTLLYSCETLTIVILLPYDLFKPAQKSI